MTPVMMTKFGRHSNCHSAAIASVLDMRIEDVPALEEYGEGKAWWDPFYAWCMEKGIGVLYFEHNLEGMSLGNCYGVVSVRLRSNFTDEEIDQSHAVVGKYTMISEGDILSYKVDIVHDPNPFCYEYAIDSVLGHMILIPPPHVEEGVA